MNDSSNSNDAIPGFLSSKEAAKELGYTVQHTRLLIREGHLEATKVGRDWLIVRESVDEYKAQRTGSRQDSSENTPDQDS